MAQFGGLAYEQRQYVIDDSLGIEILKNRFGRDSCENFNLQIIFNEADGGLIIPTRMIDILVFGQKWDIGYISHNHYRIGHSDKPHPEGTVVFFTVKPVELLYCGRRGSQYNVSFLCSGFDKPVNFGMESFLNPDNKVQSNLHDLANQGIGTEFPVKDNHRIP